MIDDRNDRAALRAMSRVLVVARHLAYEAGNDKLAKLIDAAEYLPQLLLNEPDGPAQVRNYIADCVPEFPLIQFALDTFDRDADERRATAGPAEAPRFCVRVLSPGALYVDVPAPGRGRSVTTLQLSQLVQANGAMVIFDLDAERRLLGVEVLADDEVADGDALAVQLTTGGAADPPRGSWASADRTQAFAIRALSRGALHVAMTSRSNAAYQRTVRLAELTRYTGAAVAFDLDVNGRLLGITFRVDDDREPTPAIGFELSIGTSR